MTESSSSPGRLLSVNGLQMYVEIHGSGRPLVLLHGGLDSGDGFADVLPRLSEHHQVVLPDLQGHGRTADIDRPLDPALLADDIAALIDHLELDHPDVVGYSLGGGAAWQMGFKYPDRIRRLVTVSAHVTSDAIYPDMLAQQRQVTGAAAAFMKDTPMWALYERVAPRPEDFPGLLDKVGAFMSAGFDFRDQVRALQVPTLVMAADADQAPPGHYVEIFGLLGGGERDGGWMGEGRPAGGHALAILPGQTHYSIYRSPLFAQAVLSFLDQP